MSAIVTSSGTSDLPFTQIEFSGDGTVASVASQHGCDESAIAQLLPFVVDDSFLTVLTSAGKLVRSAELITAMNAAFVRRPSMQEVLLGFTLGRPRHTVYMDEVLLEHEEILFCVEPPSGYATSEPDVLRRELRASLISLPGNPALARG